VLPRGPYAIAPEVVAADQRRRLLAALPLALAEHGFERVTVAQIVKLAAVSHGSFYKQFADKRDCFAVAYEQAQERLLGVLTFHCYTHAGPATRVERSLTAGLELLASEPNLTRMIAIEAPAAGGEILARHYEWLERYGRMLRLAVVGSPVDPLVTAIEPAIAGALVSRVARQVLAQEEERIAELAPDLVTYVLSYLDLGTVSAAPQPQSPSRSVEREPAAA
jgi:AcrR family transcriptional regulator